MNAIRTWSREKKPSRFDIDMIENANGSTSSRDNTLVGSNDPTAMRRALFENGKVNLIPMPTSDPKGTKAHDDIL